MMNQRGFGLVQVLVTVAIMGIVMTAVATMMTTQMQETKAMNDKLAALDVQRNLIAIMSQDGACTYNLSRASALGPYNFSAGDGTPSRPFPAISLGTSMAAAKPVGTTPESIAYRVTINPLSSDRSTLFPASVISLALYIKEINLRIRCDTPPCDYSTATEVPAYYELVYQDTGLVRSIAPARAAITLSVSGAAPMRNITGCYGESGGPSPGTPGTPCTSANYPNNRGIVMYHAAGYGGSRRCCGAGNGNGFVNAPWGAMHIYCD